MGGGLTSAVQSLRNRRDADFAIALLRGIQKQIEDQRAKIENYAIQTYGLTWSDLEFRLTRFGTIITVVEARSGEHVWSGRRPK